MEEDGPGKPEGWDQSNKKLARGYFREEGLSIDVCAKWSLEVVALLMGNEE